MVVGILNVKIAIREARSLKDKRRVLQRLKASIRNEFNVSVAEVDAQETPQLAIIAVAHVSNDAQYMRSSLDKLVDLFRKFGGAQMIDYHIEMVHR